MAFLVPWSSLVPNSTRSPGRGLLDRVAYSKRTKASRRPRWRYFAPSVMGRFLVWGVTPRIERNLCSVSTLNCWEKWLSVCSATVHRLLLREDDFLRTDISSINPNCRFGIHGNCYYFVWREHLWFKLINNRIRVVPGSDHYYQTQRRLD